MQAEFKTFYQYYSIHVYYDIRLKSKSDINENEFCLNNLNNAT